MRTRSSRFWQLGMMSMLGLGSVHCGSADTGNEGNQKTAENPPVDIFAAPTGTPPSVGTAREGIIGGGFVTIPNRSGIVMLVDSQNRWFCSGVLLSNLHVLTAKHCFELGDPPNQGVYVFMGNQYAFLTKGIGNPTNDLYVARMNIPFVMTVGGQDSTTGYSRPFDTRTRTQLNGQSFICAGYGHELPGDNQGPYGNQKQITLTGSISDFADGTPYHPEFIWVTHGGQEVLMGGDSGGPCFSTQIANSIATAKLTSVAFGEFAFSGGTAETLVNPSALWIVGAVFSML